MPTPSSPSSVCRRTRISFARGTMKWLTQCGRSVCGARRMYTWRCVIFTWRLFLQVAVEELHGALPRLLGRFRVVLEHVELLRICRLVGEGVLRVVAMELVLHVRRLELLLELIHARDGERLIVQRPVAEQRRLDLRGVDVLERRIAVPDDFGVGLGNVHRRKHGERTAHAEAGDADLWAVLLQVLHGAADVLARGIAEVEAFHQVPCLVRFERDFAAVEVGNERAVAPSCELGGVALDLVVQSTPFLDHHQARGTAFTLACAWPLRRFREIAADALAVGPLVARHLAHRLPPVRKANLRATTPGARRPVRSATAPVGGPPTRSPTGERSRG